MGLFDFLKRDKKGASDVPAGDGAATPAPAPSRADDPRARGLAQEKAAGRQADFQRLYHVGEPGGATVEEALSLIASYRNGPDEGGAVDALARRSRSSPLPEEVAVVGASILTDRGETDLAMRMLDHVSGSDGLMMLSDLRARAGDLPRAVATVERVLLRNLDHPGARERHQRWRAELGFGAADKAKEAAAGVTTVVAKDTDAPFEVLREVARGGAGAVYEALDRELGRKVALKVYHQPERDREQLTHEGKVAVGLEGEGVVAIYDVDPDHGWIALEWAELGALRDLIKRKEIARLLPLERWMLPLARTLARVHAGGWVHHDVKPANVLLGRDGRPLLADFGIARRIGEPSPPGSFGYVSPERLAKRASDPRDDIYGFGRLLEDVLDVVPESPATQKYRPIATACTGPDAQRPADGRALVTRMRVET
jgi:serine/threonine-protein kinase